MRIPGTKPVRAAFLIVGWAFFALCTIESSPVWFSSRADATDPAPRPAVLGNGKGFAMAGAVLSLPTAGPGSPFGYQLQPDRWSVDTLKQPKQAVSASFA